MISESPLQAQQSAQQPAQPQPGLPSEPVASNLALYDLDEKLQIVRLEEGKPVEWLSEDETASARRLDIFIGRTGEKVTSLSAVFIDIGTKQPGFLPLREAPANLKPGQPIMVQVKRLTAPGKGDQLTTRIQLPGPFAVFRPDARPRRRSKLSEWPAGQQDELFQHDLNRLQTLWQQTKAVSQTGKVPRLLLALGDPLDTALISLISPGTQFIHVQGHVRFDQVYQRIQALMPLYLPRLKLHVPDHGYTLPDLIGLSDLAEQVRRRQIWLSNGGRIVIDPTEAMTVIDVNSGRDAKGKDAQALIWRTNLAAAEEICRQLRLRNLGGIILIDFINMAEPAQLEKLLEQLQQLTNRDRARCRLFGFTRLGLFEMTRTPL